MGKRMKGKSIHKRRWKKLLCFVLIVILGVGYLPATVDRDPFAVSQDLIEAYADLLEVDTGAVPGSTSAGQMLLPSYFNGREDDFTSTAGMLMVDITEGSVIAAANPNKKYSASALAELETYWILLKEVDKELFQSIPADANNFVDADTALSKIGSGGSAVNEDVLRYYINSGSPAARSVLIHGLMTSQEFLKAASQKVSKSMLSNKSLLLGNGAYDATQKFTAYDIYYLIYQLILDPWFCDNIGLRSMTITGRRADGLLVKQPYQPYGMGGIKIPKGYEGLCRMVSGNQQFILLRGNDLHLYLAVVLGAEKDSTGVMEKFLKVLDGEEYSEEPPATPTPEPTPTPSVTEPPVVSATPTPVPAEPTKRPENTITPTPEPTSDPGEPEEDPLPTVIPTPAITPDITTPAEPQDPTPSPEYPDNANPPVPSKKPDKTPDSGSGNIGEETGIDKKVMLPTESNNARYQYIFGTDEQIYTTRNLPSSFNTEAKARKQMTTITVPVWKMTASGGRYSSKMTLTINKKVAKNVQAIFDEIYALDLKFPIKDLRGYGYRKVGGVGLSNSTLMSMHSFGIAIDINPGDYDNDYFLGAGNDLRDKSNPYCIPDEVIDIFAKYGWFWGGNFSICADTMHFQYLGLDFLTYQNNSPFRELAVEPNYMKGSDVRNLQQRLSKLGFSVQIDGIYGKSTESVIKKAQQKYGLPVTGVVDYKTWETIINLTHYMPYVF